MIETAVATPDGRAGAQLLLPSGTGPWAGVLFYMDGLGIRPGLVGMAHRLAEEGYAVLLPDLYYRCGDYAPFDPGHGALGSRGTPQTRHAVPVD